MTRLVLVAGCLTLLGSVGRAEDRPPAPSNDQVRVPVPVDELVETFQTNEIRAERLYADQELEIAGRVVRVITSRYGRPGQAQGEDAYVVELQTEPLDISRVSVQCYFGEAERERLAGLKRGQAVVISGECLRRVLYTGKYADGEKDYVEIRFRNCKVIGPK